MNLIPLQIVVLALLTFGFIIATEKTKVNAYIECTNVVTKTIQDIENEVPTRLDLAFKVDLLDQCSVMKDNI